MKKLKGVLYGQKLPELEQLEKEGKIDSRLITLPIQGPYILQENKKTKGYIWIPYHEYALEMGILSVIKDLKKMVSKNSVNAENIKKYINANIRNQMRKNSHNSIELIPNILSQGDINKVIERYQKDQNDIDEPMANYKYTIENSFIRELEHVIDYFNSIKEPKELFKINVKDAVSASNKWTESLIRKATTDEGKTKTVFESSVYFLNDLNYSQ
jgi:hypothetical protein